MSSPVLAWYASVLLWFYSLLFALIKVVPEAESHPASVICFAGALAFAILGVSLGWLPPEHWLRRSWKVRSILLAGAGGLTLLLSSYLGCMLAR